MKGQLFKFLMGPNLEYKNLRSQVLNQENLLDLAKVIAIMKEDHHARLFDETP